MTSVDVGVCTFRRPAVAETLASLARQALPDGVRLRVIVADNDETPSAEALVRRTAAEHGLDLAYAHAPARNICIARNACLDAARADWFAFIDDDEIATPGWLAALLAEAERGGWDAVLGPVKAVYGAGAPDWIAGTHTNGDAATIVTSKDVEFTTTPEPDGFDLTLKPRAANALPVAAPTEPVETDPLRGDTKEAGAEIDGLQRKDLRIAFGVPEPSDSGL